MSKLICFIVLNFMLCTCCLAQNAESSALTMEKTIDGTFLHFKLHLKKEIA